MRLLRLPLALFLVLGLAGTLPSTAEAAAKCSRRSCDSTLPLVAVTRPTSGSTVSGAVTVAGTASDNVGLASVAVRVDGGTWQPVSGLSGWSWTWNTASVPNGSHTVTARATDTSGNLATASVSVTVSNPVADTTAPSVGVSSPTSGSTVSGTASVSGSASDNAGVAAVAVSVDGGPWQAAAGTTSWNWSWNTAGLANGTHTLAARATDGAGNAATSTVTLTVANSTPDTTAPAVAFGAPGAGATVAGTTAVSGTASDDRGLTGVEVQVDGGPWQTASGTGSWSWSWNTAPFANGSHTLTARASDTSGNFSVTTRTVTVSNTTSAGTCGSTGAAPYSSTVTPEGAKIRICTTAGGWSTDAIYTMLKENSAAAGDLAKLAPTLTIEVQDRYASQTLSAASAVGGRYTGFKGTMYLCAVDGSVFSTLPDATFGHEYGHFWNLYHLYMARQGDWSSYLDTRWANDDGSVKLSGDSRLGTSSTWSKGEIFADDYRLLFGSAKAISQRNGSLNTNIPDPRNQPGLADFMLSTWRTAV